MAGLHFDITADNQNFIRRVEEATRGVANASKQMQLEGKKIDSAFNGISFGDTLKRQIYDSSQAVNGLTDKIISQRKTVRDLTQDVNTLKEAYKKVGADTEKGRALSADLDVAKLMLKNEKNLLFELQTQQAQARLSVRKLRDEYSLYEKEGQIVVDSNEKMALSFKKTLASIGGTAMIKKFVSDVVQIRGQFQQLDVAFTTLLQSKEKANALMAQMVQTAAKTPFNLTELANGAKQLVAYGFASEGVNDTLIRLGNIAAGLGLPLERLTYLYGTTMTQGRLYARDLMQFTTSGIPMLQGLADMFGVSTDKVNEMVTAGQIGFPQVEKVIENMTNQGGKFFNLMEEQSKTITGKISNLGDSWAEMLNKIGQSQEGTINASIDGLKYLIENYEAVGREVMAVATAFGTYKAILITVAAYQSASTGITYAAEIAELSKLIPLKQQSVNEDVIAAVASGKLTESKAEQIIAIRGEINAKIQSLQVTQSMAIAETAAAQAEYKAALQRSLASKQAYRAKLAELEASKGLYANKYIYEAAKAQQLSALADERSAAAKSKKVAAQNLEIAKSRQNAATTALEAFQTNVNTGSQRANAASTSLLAVAKTKLAAASKALGLSMLTNPYVLAAAAVAGLAYVTYKAFTAETALEKATRKQNEAIEEQKRQLDELKEKTNGLVAIVKDENSTRYDKVKAYKQLQALMPTVFSNMDIETLKLLDILSLNKQISEELNRRERIGAKTNVVLAQKKYDSASAKYQKDVENGLIGAGSLAEKSEAFVELEAAKKVVADIEKIQIEANKQKEKESNKEIIKNKEHWDTQKKDAETALDAIDSKQRKLLNAGKFDKVDSKVVANYKEQKHLIAEAEKELKAYPSASDTSKQDKTAEKLREQQEKLSLLMDKQALDQSRSAEDLQTQVDQARINAMDEGSKKTLAQMELNFEKEMQAIDRQKEDLLRKKIEDERAKFDKKEDENAAKDPKHVKQTFDPTGIVLSDGENKQFDSLYKAQIAEKEKEEKAYLDNLLEKHQDYTDKRLAIEKKFNADIAALDEQRKKAVENGDTQQVEQIDRAKAQATKNKGKELISMDYDKLKESPEYVRAFENLKETSSETLNSLLSQLENAKGAAAKVLSPDQLREYTTTIQDIMNELRNPFQALSDKKQELADAEQELAQAQIALENARQTAETVKGGGKVEYTTTKFNQKTGKIDSTKAYLTEAQALENVKTKTDNYNKSKDNAVKASTKVRKSEKEVRDIIDDLSKSISDVGNSIGGPAGEIISLIGNIGSFAMMAMSGVETASKTTSTAIQTVEKASVILAIISAAIQIATKMLDLFGGDNTTEKYESTKEAYESYINIFDQVIDKQLEMAESLSGASAQAAYDKAIELVKTQSEAARVLGKQYLNSGASWKNHSKGYEEVEDMSSAGWADAAKALGMSVDQIKNTLGGRMGGLFDLTDEQLAKLQGEAHIFWAQLDDDTQDYANQIAEGVSKVAEVIEQQMADVTLIDVDTLRSDFHDLLTDMDADTADFAGNFEEYMKNAILNSMLKEQYMGRLTEWRKKFYAAMDNGVTEEEYSKLKAEGQQIADDMKNDRDNMKDMYGWTSGESTSQDSTNGGFQSMSQDTGNELNGRFTALQISNEEIKNSMLAMLSGVNLISTTNTANGITLMEIRNVAMSSNSYLEDIAGFQKNIVGLLRSDLGEIKQKIKTM